MTHPFEKHDPKFRILVIMSTVLFGWLSNQANAQGQTNGANSLYSEESAPQFNLTGSASAQINSLNCLSVGGIFTTSDSPVRHCDIVSVDTSGGYCHYTVANCDPNRFNQTLPQTAVGAPAASAVAAGTTGFSNTPDMVGD